MKHLLKKISLVGAGGGRGGGGGGGDRPQPPPPAKLEPPKFGIYKPYSSYNQVEIVDLLCEGPIHGLVNPLGRDLEPENILQGIYLDDTPISTSSSFSDASSEIFNDYALNTNIAKLGDILATNTSADKASGFFTSLVSRADTGFDSYLNNNPNCLLLNVLHLYYNGAWYFYSLAYHSPSIEKSTDWEKVTTVGAWNLDGGGVTFKRIADLWYYKNKIFTNLELHVMSTAKFVGIAKRAKDAWGILKDNTSINQYERQIIEKKLNLLETAFRSTHTQYNHPSLGDAGWWFYSTGGWVFFQVSGKLDRTDSLNIGIKSGTTDVQKTVVSNGKLIDFGFILQNSGMDSNLILDCIIPEIDSNNQFNGKVYGFVGIKIPCSNKTTNAGARGNYENINLEKTSIDGAFLSSLKKVMQLGFSKNITQASSVQYNYNNVLCEVKYGTRNQTPLSHFSKIYFDTDYKNRLIGPFRTNGRIKRFVEQTNLLNPFYPDRNVTYLRADSRVYLNNHGFQTGDQVKIFSQRKNVTFRKSDNRVILKNHALTNGMIVRFDTLNLISVININTNYYVRNVDQDTFQLSTKAANAIITFGISTDVTGVADLEKTSGITSDTVYFVTDVIQGVSFRLAETLAKANAATYFAILMNNSAVVNSVTRRSHKQTDGVLNDPNPVLLPTTASTNIEGSQDNDRLSNKGSYTEIQQTFDEDAIPITHYVENLETKSAIVTILINELTDTLTKALDIDGNTVTTDGTNVNLEQPGTKIPTVVSILIQTGKDVNGKPTITNEYNFTIYGNIPSACSIDFGNPNNDLSSFNFVVQNNQNINEPIKLPDLSDDEVKSQAKRFIKVFKVSTETHSVLVKKEIYVEKITEIIDLKFSYPFSALVGSKIDARNQSAIPMRSFDCRLKKIKVPANYNIMEGGYDVRYQKSKSTYETAGRKLIYNGDWNGEFKTAWTDNPAWILFDILINKRYGLGRYIDESQINIWDLYKIARYCDAVDDNGYYYGVSDGRGGLEPRFSCNVIFNSPIKVFDAINVISNLFRGSVFFSAGEINFSDDRPKQPTVIFNNSNIKDGVFNYISNKKEDIFNTVEVAYLDRFDNFKTKIELIEDSEDIRKRGIQKTVVNTMGVTSRSMARRIGQHIIWQTTKENQAIEFVAGLESLFCKPGDLIVIDDDLKTRSVNCGRVLEVDAPNNSLRLDNVYDDVNFDGYITLYTPTGFLTKDELYKKSIADRNRYTSFKINSTNSSISSLTGTYVFDKYDGFNMASYTGYNSTAKYNIYCYYDHVDDGWVLSTGLAYQRNTLYDKLITKEIPLKGELNLNPLYQYASDNSTRKGAAINTSTDITYGEFYNEGIFDNEILTESPRQITKYRISGASTNIDDGSIVYLDPRNFNLSLLSIIEPGSTYRIGMKSPFIDEVYKVIAVREENQNEYLIVATKYDSGKWSVIENDAFIENPQQIFYENRGVSKISSLETPSNLYLDAINENKSTFDITGTFDSSYITTRDFRITLENKAVGYRSEIITRNKFFNFSNLNDLGRYDLTVQVLKASATELDSYPAKTQKYIGYQKTEVSIFDRPYIETFTIL